VDIDHSHSLLKSHPDTGCFHLSHLSCVLCEKLWSHYRRGIWQISYIRVENGYKRPPKINNLEASLTTNCSISGKFFRHDSKQSDQEEPKFSVSLLPVNNDRILDNNYPLQESISHYW